MILYKLNPFFYSAKEHRLTIAKQKENEWTNSISIDGSKDGEKTEGSGADWIDNENSGKYIARSKIDCGASHIDNVADYEMDEDDLVCLEAMARQDRLSVAHSLKEEFLARK